MSKLTCTWAPQARVRDVLSVRKTWQSERLRAMRGLGETPAHQSAMLDVARAISQHGAVTHPGALANTLYVYRESFPSIADQLQPQHFVPLFNRDRNYHEYVLSPNPAVAQSWWTQLVASAVDVFPHVTMSSDDTPENRTLLRLFLAQYRAAERLVVRGHDPKEPDVHCGFSTSHLRRMFAAKGMMSHALVCTRLLHDDAMAQESVLQHLHVWAEGTKRSSYDVHYSLREIGRGHWHDRERRGDIRRWESLSPIQQDVVLSASVPHAVALLRLGAQYYVVDVNSQQFGARFDRLVFYPVTEASAHGYVFGYVQGAFHERIRPFADKLGVRHAKIRDEMLRQGSVG